MNIFYLHKDPAKAASYFYDKHKVKMILESAQMLCTAHHYWNERMGISNEHVPYKKAHLNHPSTIWCRQNKSQYFWLYDHMLAIGNEYTKRYGKHHMSIEKCKTFLSAPPPGMPDGLFKQPPQCMPDEYKQGDAIHGYWNYYIKEKHTVTNNGEAKHKHIPTEVEKLLL